MKTFILYDMRALSEGTDEATIYVVCDSEEEAREFADDWSDTVCFEYDDTGELTNEKVRLDLSAKRWRGES